MSDYKSSKQYGKDKRKKNLSFKKKPPGEKPKPSVPKINVAPQILPEDFESETPPEIDRKETPTSTNTLKDFIAENPRPQVLATVTSKWIPYQVPEVEEEPIGNNYKDLIDAPQNAGGHFRFKSEKEWDKTISETKLGSIFNLDLTLLAKGLASIPMNERLDLPDNIFTKNELDSIRLEGKKNQEIYEEFLKTRNINLNENEDETDLNAVIDDEQQHSEELASESLLNSEETKSHADELDCISNLNIDETSNEQMNSAQSTQKPLQPQTGVNESLDEWLDSILDD